MIYRKIFLRAELLLCTNGTNGTYQRKPRQVHTRERASVYGRMRISMSRKLTNYHRCLLSTKRCPAREQKLASSFEAFVWVGNIQRACSVLTFRVFWTNDLSAASVQWTAIQWWNFVLRFRPFHRSSKEKQYEFSLIWTSAIRRFDECEASQFVDPPVCCSVYRERERERERGRESRGSSVRQLSPILCHCRAMLWVFPNTGEHPVLSCTRRSYDYAVPIRSHLHPSFFVPPSPLRRLAPFLSASHSLTHFSSFFLRGRGLRPCTPNHASIFTWCGGTKLPSSNIIRREFRWRDCLDPRSTGTSLLRMENLTRPELAVCRPMEAALSSCCSGFLCLPGD